MHSATEPAEAALFDLPTSTSSDLHFYLGTPEPSWLWRSYSLPLFVSHRRIARLKRLRPGTAGGWALDSGGFTELDKFGGWRTSPRDYVAAVARYDVEIGCLEWAAPQDWMCEAKMLAKTGLTAFEHERRTVENGIELRALWPQYSDDTCPIMYALQGRPGRPDDYLRCIELYREYGVDLTVEPLVGLGSVCRQENTRLIEVVVRAVAEALPGVPLHGYGVKAGGLSRVGHLLASADSQAWSRGARYRAEQVRTPHCTHRGPCTWCPHHAMAWRADVRAAAGRAPDVARFGAPHWESWRRAAAA